MKTAVSFFLLFVSNVIFAQCQDDSNGISVDFLRGNILPHSPNLQHLITGHPEGVMVSLFKKTHGSQEWQALYNYPDYGGYFLFQDFKNEILGKNYALGAFYNFYFLNRHLTLKVAQGIAMTTNPYNKETNNKNTAFGSRYMGNTDFVLNYKQENILDKMGIQAGFVFTHFSCGRLKSPNSGINTYSLNLGINYNLDDVQKKYDSLRPSMKFTEPIKYNIVSRTGYNESPIAGSGQKPFYHISFYADKRINRKSALQLGSELFLTTSNKEYIKFRSIAYPEDGISATTDYKRVGVFVGHELFINRVSIETQLGYYIYQPFKSELPVYDRLGLKYYFTKRIFTGASVKTHGFLAEAMELVLGVRI
jgi:hypothetical protein